MNELKLFSFRRIIISSLVLGVITLMLLNSAIGNPLNSSSDDTTNNVSDITTTEDITTVSNSNTDPNEVVTETVTVAGNENFDQNAAEDASRFGPAKIISLSDDRNLFDYFSIGFYVVVISSFFFGMFFVFYNYLYNNKELTLYLNHSLNQSGFQHKISQIGKKWNILTNTGKQFSMRLVGVRKLSMEIILPLEETTDPREFGFRTSKPNAVTFCNLEVLPMRLQVVQLYITDLG